MSLWQAVLSSISGVLGGIAIGSAYFYVRIRYFENYPVSMLAILSALFHASPRRLPSRGLAPASGLELEEFSESGPDSIPGRSTVNLAASLPPVPEEGEREILGILSEFAADIRSTEGPSADNDLPEDDLASQGNQTVVRRLLSSLRNALEDDNAIRSSLESYPRSDQVSAPYAEIQSDSRESVRDNGSSQTAEGKTGIGPQILSEMKQNRKAIEECSGDNLVAMRTDAWNTGQRQVRNLSTFIRNELETIYVEIGLLNHLTWLSCEFDRNTPAMLQQYRDLSAKIADKIDDLISTSTSDLSTEEQALEPAI